MAFVSYTQSASGQPMQFTMNKNDVLTIPKVIADPFFSLEANWYRVGFVFKHTTSNKRFTPSFRNFSSTKRLKIRSGMVDGDIFELKKIILYKSDRTFLVIKTNEIPSVASYMFSLSGSGEETGGGGGGVIVDPPVDPPVAPAVAMGSFFDGRLSLNTGTWSKYSDTSFFATANRFVTIGYSYHSQGGDVSFGGISLKSAIIDTTTGDLNETASNLLQDKRIRAIHYKSDLSKAWVIGQFGTEYEGTQLPALPAYNGSTFQSSNCFRILEINLSSGAIVHKLDIQTSYDAVGFGGQHSYGMFDMKIDETSGDVFLLNSGYVVKYNFTTGPVWGKTIQNGYGSNEKYRYKLTLTSDSIFINVRNYDGVELTGYSWNNGGYIKISKLDGSRDTSFVIPNENNNYYPDVVRAISSDGSKIVYAIYDTVISNLVAHTYSNGTWTKHSDIRITNGGLFGLIAENDYFYILAYSSNYPYNKYVQKVDYSGNSISITYLDTNPNDYYQSPLQHSFYKKGEKIYYRSYSHQLKKHDLSTGATETLDIPIAFTGNDQLILSFNGDKAIVGVENYDYATFTFKDASYLEVPSTMTNVPIGVYNASTGELVKATAYAATDYFDQRLTRILKSSSILDKCWFVTSYGKIHEIDLVTGNVSLVSNLSFGSDYRSVITFTDGNFLYAIGKNNQFSITDSTGTYTKDYMARINLSTKLLDQSFSISDPSWGQTEYRDVSITDNFIYVTSSSNQVTKSMVRFRKSNFTQEVIDYSATFPASSIQYRQEVVGIGKLDSTRIIVYGKNKDGNTSGWAKPYLIFDEESMTPVASQPSFTGEAQASFYFPEFGKLVAFVNDATYGWQKDLAVFDVIAGTKTVYANASKIYNGYQQTPTNIMFYDNHVFLEMGYSSNYYANKQFTGIIKINSSGEVVE